MHSLRCQRGRLCRHHWHIKEEVKRKFNFFFNVPMMTTQSPRADCAQQISRRVRY